jgi:hypothetical protein
MVPSIEEHHLDLRVLERLRRGQAGEPTADDEHTGELLLVHGPPIWSPDVDLHAGVAAF